MEYAVDHSYDVKDTYELEPNDDLELSDDSEYYDDTCWPCEYAEVSNSRHCGKCECCSDVRLLVCPECGITYSSSKEYVDACPRSENCGFLGDLWP
jgi:hypothetical protein